ncbi:MAG: hypothetical protein U9Q81_00595 [Pseudomonadota bacterium]|nr:hypothetical protein [Pseudomonadota bacterium]
MIQLWVLPDEPGKPAGYRIYKADNGRITRVYGGEAGQEETIDSRTLIDVARLEAGQEISVARPFPAYMTGGQGKANGETVEDGALVRGEQLEFKALEEAQLILVHTQTSHAQ